MFTSLNLIYFIMFLFPGGFIKLLLNRFAPRKRKAYTNLMETSELLLGSFLVLIINLPLVEISYNSFNINDNFFIENFSFIFLYTAFSFLICPLVAFGYYYFNKYLIHFFVNKFNKMSGRQEEATSNDVLENIFNHNTFKNINLNDSPVISIEKNGQILVRGRLCMYPGDGAEKREFVVNDSEIIDLYFEREVIFDSTTIQYCDIDSGTVIKIYDMSKFNDYVEQYYKNN